MSQIQLGESEGVAHFPYKPTRRVHEGRPTDHGKPATRGREGDLEHKRDLKWKRYGVLGSLGLCPTRVANN